jgi:hypothetical protein
MARKSGKGKKGSSKGKKPSGRAPRRTCGAMGVHHMLMETYPAFRRNQMAMERKTARMMADGMSAIMPDKPRRIPVVVHVVHRTEAENLSKGQIMSQIAGLNRDFRARNRDRFQVPRPFKCLVTDSMIEFELATRDPDGGETDGITRTKTDVRGFSASDNGVKSSRSGGIEPWPTDRYLNIWVCNLAGGLLGYAQFPGGPPATDGVVVLTTAFGTRGNLREPFNGGRTTTHEVGHYFNLRHIWGDREDCGGTDFVVDTPNAVMPNFGRPEFPHVTCDNGPNGDMFMNYMDYVDDAAMHMFTAGQVARMQAALTMARNKLGT